MPHTHARTLTHADARARTDKHTHKQTHAHSLTHPTTHPLYNPPTLPTHKVTHTHTHTRARARTPWQVLPEVRTLYRAIVFAVVEDERSFQTHNPSGNFGPFAAALRAESAPSASSVVAYPQDGPTTHGAPGRG